jgi:polysaccharide biosynthesis transport protein
MKASFDMPTPNHYSMEEEDFSSTTNLRNLWHTLIDKIWIIALCACAAAFLSLLYLKHATRTYASKAVLQVEQDKPKVVNIESVQSENYSSIDFLKTVEQTLLSRSLFERVIDANDLANDARFVSPSPAPGETPSKASLISKLAGMVDVRLRAGTRLIDVTVEDEHPELTALIARSLVQQFMVQNREQQSLTSQEANTFLLEEAQRLETQLRKSEDALQAFKERTQFLPSDNQLNVIVQKLKEQWTQAKADRIKVETEYKQFERALLKPAALLAIPSIASDHTIIQLQSNITMQQGEIARLEQRYKALHPKMIEARSQLAKWDNALQTAVLKVGETLKSSYDNAKAAELALQNSLTEEERLAIGGSKVGIEYARLHREAESDRTLHQTFLNRMKETAVTKDLGASKIRIVQQAEIPESPVKPQRRAVLAAGIGAGLLIGVALALLLGAFDSSLKSLDEAEEYLRMPALSTVPQITSGQLDSSQLVMGRNSAMSGAESFRSLRTSLSLLGEKKEQKICLFTSALPEEGKTFCSLNYAFSLAQQGLRVLLIDCDLRRPAVEQCLCATQGELTGLSDFLTARQSFKDVVYDTGINNFYFVPAGTPAPNPSELLTQNKFNEMIEEALNHFDRIVLDSAPIFGVSDTLLMAKRVHTACLVVRACKTPRKKVLRAIQILQNAGTPLAGLILNRVPPNDRRNGNDPYYDYGYALPNSENIVPMLRIARASASASSPARASGSKAS